MVQETYTRRVQRVLSELVKDNKGSIHYKSFMLEVRSVKLRSSVDGTSAFRRGLRDALMVEMDAGRLSINTSQVPAVILLTPVGKTFYGSLVLPPLRHAQRKPAVHTGLSRRAKALAEYQGIYAILQPVRDTVAARLLTSAEEFSVTKIPGMIESFLETEDALRSQNIHLTERVNELNWESDCIESGLW
ncbi:hypothetical protein OH76DRAFT_1481319 [Lentinus brumalis]|uniref:Uncharacterized protein n=1 Tax=Lentinus brumalis TaxID=2498619 RepID=A0A371DGZ8_9APHY|nr:hypothetical protein OH76DRAFT_1481319 [Polyporus brumalis]